MTFVASNAQDLSRQGRLRGTTPLSIPRSLLGTVVGLCQQQTDRGPRLWMQLQSSDGGRTWRPSPQSDIILGQFLRMEVETGTVSTLPVVLPADILERLYTSCPDPADLDRLLWLIAGIQHLDLRMFMLDVLQDEAIALPLVRHAASCRHL